MSIVNFIDTISINTHNILGKSISKATTEKLLNNIKGMREAHNLAKIPVKGYIYKALETKAAKTKNISLKNKIHYEMSSFILHTKISDVSDVINKLGNENDVNIKKLQNKGNINQEVAQNIRSATTCVSSKNSVKNADIKFRLLMSSNMKLLNIDGQKPKLIKKSIELNNKKINELKRNHDAISVARAACILRGLNNNHLSVQKGKDKKSETINFYSNLFTRSFSTKFLIDCLKMNEIDDIYKMTGINKFTQEEFMKIGENPIFEKSDYYELISLIEKKIKHKENKNTQLECELKNTEKAILEVEVLSVEEYIESEKSTDDKYYITKRIAAQQDILTSSMI